MAISYPALKTELQTDPTGLGYAASVAAGTDGATADIINTVRATISIRRSDVSAQEVWGAIDLSDYTALSGNPTAAQLSTERRQIAWLTGLAAVDTIRLLNDDGTNAPPIANLQAMFPAGSATRTRMIALASRQGSRAEQLFGAGTVVTAADVAKALR